MHPDTRRRTATVLAFIATVTVNIAANALPINGLRTGEISDRFAVYVIPAGYVFAIWGLIYLLLGAFTIWQALPRTRESGVLRSLGFLPAVTGMLNAGWILLWHYQLFVLTVPVMVALLATLIAIHLRLWRHRAVLGGTAYWTVRAPWSVYLGWITVATIANVAQALAALGFTGLGVEPALLGAGVLAGGTAIAVTFVTRFGDAAYGLVIAWAYVGVALKESDTPIVAGVAAVGAALAGGLGVVALIRRRLHGRGTGVGATAAA